MKNDIIYLISVTRQQDEDGFETETASEFKCLAEVTDTKYTEYYQASLAGIKASVTVALNYDDYMVPAVRPTKVRIDDTVYKIVRRYRKKIQNSIELTLEEVDDVDGSGISR